HGYFITRELLNLAFQYPTFGQVRNGINKFFCSLSIYNTSDDIHFPVARKGQCLEPQLFKANLLPSPYMTGCADYKSNRRLEQSSCITRLAMRKYNKWPRNKLANLET